MNIIAEVTSVRSPYRHASLNCSQINLSIVTRGSGKEDCPKCWYPDGYKVSREPEDWEAIPLPGTGA